MTPGGVLAFAGPGPRSFHQQRREPPYPWGTTALAVVVGLLHRYSNLRDALVLMRRLDQVAQTSSAVTARPLVRRHKLRHRLDAETIEAIVTTYVGGSSSYAVAEQFGISKTAVLDLMRSRGVVRPMGARPEHCRQLESAEDNSCSLVNTRETE